jgi:choline dehydrogenase
MVLFIGDILASELLASPSFLPTNFFFPSTFPVLSDWSPTLSNLGIPTNTDPTSGNNTGSFIANSAIRKSDWTRSYSRAGYIDSIQQNRDNLVILTGATVTSIVWDSSADSSGNLKATGVQYAFSAGGAKKTVNANKEVILAGGTIGSAQV